MPELLMNFAIAYIYIYIYGMYIYINIIAYIYIKSVVIFDGHTDFLITILHK